MILILWSNLSQTWAIPAPQGKEGLERHGPTVKNGVSDCHLLGIEPLSYQLNVRPFFQASMNVFTGPYLTTQKADKQLAKYEK